MKRERDNRLDVPVNFIGKFWMSSFRVLVLIDSGMAIVIMPLGEFCVLFNGARCVSQFFGGEVSEAAFFSRISKLLDLLPRDK